MGRKSKIRTRPKLGANCAMKESSLGPEKSTSSANECWFSPSVMSKQFLSCFEWLLFHFRSLFRREHWFVIIVCNPGLVLSQKRQADFENARRQQRKLENKGVNPFFLVLDSLSATHSTALNKIRTYLQFEHLERKKYPLTFGKDKMDEKNPEIPLQPNSCDCGLFLLHYVELIFQVVI